MRLAFALLLLALFRSSALAQAPTWLRVEADSVERAGPWRARLVAQGAIDPGAMRPETSSVPRSRYDAIQEVSTQIAEARRAAAELDEAAALLALVEALREVEAQVDLPGTSRWLAEIEANLGIVAAQAGHAELAAQAFARMASLDPERVVGAAEAPPDVVEAAATIARSVATGPVGAFLVDVEPTGAAVFLDDRLLGRSPVEIETSVGRHVLRVEHDGYVAWASALDVLEGRRPPLELGLERTREAHHRRAIGTASSLREAQEQLSEGEQLWWITVGSGPRARALWWECRREGCSLPAQLEGLRSTASPGEPVPWELLELESRQAHTWLEAPVLPPPKTPWFRRWPLWAGVGAAIAIGSVAAVLASRPEPIQERVVVIEDGALVP